MSGFMSILAVFGQILFLCQTILPAVINIFTLLSPLIDYLSSMFNGTW